MSLETKLKKLNDMIDHGATPEEVQKMMDEMAADRKAERSDELPDDAPQELRDHINDLRAAGHDVKIKVVSKEFDTPEDMATFLKDMHKEHMKTCTNCREAYEAEQRSKNEPEPEPELQDGERRPIGWMIFVENRAHGHLVASKEEAETNLAKALEHPLAKIAASLGSVPNFQVRPVFAD